MNLTIEECSNEKLNNIHERSGSPLLPADKWNDIPECFMHFPDCGIHHSLLYSSFLD
jgi:hypothetical protein